MPHLILVRHGESRWNVENRFTGWADVPLSKRGVEEAVESSRKLKDITIHHAFTSSLERAHETLTIILSQQKLTGIFLHLEQRKQKWYSCKNCPGKTDILAHTTSLLNERYYGTIQGMDKNAVRRKYGKEKVFEWRRSYMAKPPGGESLYDVYRRVIPFFVKRIIPLLKKNKNVIISSHGNTLRAILKYIEEINISQVPHIDLPFAEPIIYAYRRNAFEKKIGSLQFSRPVFWEAPKKKI